jgi:hypothetical protein
VRDLLWNRLENLQHEYPSASNACRPCKRKLGQLRDTLLRIEGAIQVVRELVDEAPWISGIDGQPYAC